MPKLKAPRIVVRDAQTVYDEILHARMKATCAHTVSSGRGDGAWQVIHDGGHLFVATDQEIVAFGNYGLRLALTSWLEYIHDES